MSPPKFTLGAILTVALLFACAPDVGPFFTPPDMPEDQAAFNRGRIGLLTPVLRKENELIAFRLLSGLKMDGEPGGIGGRKRSIVDDPDTAPVTGQQAWLQKRRTVQDPPAPVYVNAYRNTRSGNNFVYYENCLSGAFETAAHTLGDRRKSYNSESTLKLWVAAQDQVFEDCNSEKPAYPDPLPNDASLLAREDREYQIAAAHFYALDLAEAERRFRMIAKDDKSPWHQIAPYLVGRTLLRQASLQNDTAALTEARDQFTKIANNKSAGSLADSARGLIEHLNAMQQADATLELLSQRMLTPEPSPGSLADALQQSAFVLRAPGFQAARSAPAVPEPFDWVETLEKRDKEHSLERWRSRKSLPWLTLAVMYASGNDPAAPDLIAEAERLPDSSPAFDTATYNAIRLRLERGETEHLAARLDHLLAQTNGPPDSLVNAWRAERMRVAANFDDLLRWAARKPIPDGGPSGEQAPYGSPVLAYDSAYILNYRTPLAKLNHAAHSDLLPAWSAANVAAAGWTRAFMLNDWDAARELAPLAAKAHPDWTASWTPQTGEEFEGWRFRAALLIALHPEFQPLVRVNRRTELNSGGSWWCPVTEPPVDAPRNDDDEGTWISWRLPVVFTPPESALSQQDRQTAGRQISDLHDKGSAESFLAPIIFTWAKTHPEDPLVPQALHRLVVVTRYGCRNGDPSTSQISKSAFDLLHKRYPKSPWTARTPYWF